MARIKLPGWLSCVSTIWLESWDWNLEEVKAEDISYLHRGDWLGNWGIKDRAEQHQEIAHCRISIVNGEKEEEELGKLETKWMQERVEKINSWF